MLGVAAAVTFLVGTVALWYGFAMSFLVLGAPGGPYFQTDRVLLGNVPLIASIAMLCAAAWFTRRALPKATIRPAAAMLYAVAGAMALLFAGLVVVALIHQR